jgi:hypothetical protein
MEPTVTDADLAAYLDEALPADQMARMEERLRDDKRLLARLTSLLGRRDAGVHSLGEIWRRERLSCPDREQLGSYLLGALGDDMLDYVEFHLREVGCRLCQANLHDLESRQAEAAETVGQRRRKYFQSSAGLLARK